MDAVELTWKRCLDGYRLLVPTGDEIRAWEEERPREREQASERAIKAAQTVYARRLAHVSARVSANVGPSMLEGALQPVSRFVPVSDRIVDYEVMHMLTHETRSTRRAKPIDLVERFANTATDPASICEFYRDLGPLTSPGINRGSEELETWLQSQQNIRHILKLIEVQRHEEVRRLYQSNDFGHCNVRLVPMQGGEIGSRLRFEPRSLLSLVWMLAGDAARGTTKVVSCAAPRCDNLLLIGKGAGHHRRTTCSSRCRSALHKVRHNVHLADEERRL